MTLYWNVNPDASSTHPFLMEAGQLLARGGTVAFPTETVYGLGANATDTAAVEAIFAAKGRPSDNPLIVHIAEPEQLDAIVEDVDAFAQRLMDAFWPGPLTLVLPVRPGQVSPRVTAGLTTVAVRMPAHPVALGLIRAAGCPVAAPSANRSGRPSPTTARHVRDDLDGRIDGIVDGGAAGVGLESTVVRTGPSGIVVLRPGGVTAAQLRRALPTAPLVQPTPADAEAPRSPGMKYAHYAPQGKLLVVVGDAGRTVPWTCEALAEAKRSGERTGVLTVREHADSFAEAADVVIVCGGRDDMEAAANSLYAALRSFDDRHVTYIIAEGYDGDRDDIGFAYMNRLEKAAGHRVIRL